MKRINYLPLFLFSICIVFEIFPRVSLSNVKRIESVPTDYFLGIPCAEYPVYRVVTTDSNVETIKTLVIDTNDKKIKIANYLINAGITLLGICFFCFIIREHGKLSLAQ